jgi:hypothetical protein
MSRPIVASASYSSRRADVTCEQASFKPPPLAPCRWAKGAVRGIPAAPTPRFLETQHQKTREREACHSWWLSEADRSRVLSKPLPMQSCLRTRGAGALAGQLNGKNSKLPRCVSCLKAVDFQVQAQDVASNRVRLRYYTCTYWVDGGKQPLAWAFLGRDPDSSREDKDTGATTVDRPRTNWESQREVDVGALSLVRAKAPPPHGQDSPAFPEAFRPAFPDRGPYQQRTRASWSGRDRVKGRQGRPSHPLFLSPSSEDADPVGTSVLHLLATRLVTRRSPSLSTCIRMDPSEARPTFDPGASTNESTSRNSLRSSPRPYAGSRVR